MRVCLAVASAILLAAGVVAANESESMEWDHEGYASVFKAAAAAKKEQKRILVGLSGSGT